MDAANSAPSWSLFKTDDSNIDATNIPAIEKALPKQQQQITWQGLHGCAAQLAVAQMVTAQVNQNKGGLTVVITNNSTQAQRWQNGLEFALRGADGSMAAPKEALDKHQAAQEPNQTSSRQVGQKVGQKVEQKVWQLPDWETLAYDAFSPHQDIISERLSTLAVLPKLDTGILVLPISTALQKLAPKNFIQGSSFRFSVADELDLEQQLVTLDGAGYHNADIVRERGQYAIRGSVLDIFPMGEELPVRIDLFDREIDTLRRFDPETQRTVEQIQSLNILPAKEFPFDSQAISRFRNSWHQTFNVDVRRCSVYQDVSDGISPNGVEYYLPFFFDQLDTLFDYLPKEAVVVLEEGVFESASHHLDEIKQRYESLRHDIERPIIAPTQLYLSQDQLHHHVNQHQQIHIAAADSAGAKHPFTFSTQPLPDLLSEGRNSDHAALREYAAQQPTLFVAESAGRREIFDELLRKSSIQTKHINQLNEYPNAQQHCLVVAPLDQGVSWDGFSIITETDVLGTRQTNHQLDRSQRIIDPDQIVRNLTELNIGAPVVHIEHGVGRYMGLQSLEIDNESHEFLTLVYADDDKLYVPVTALHLIGRYAGSDEEHAPLHRLGSDQWEKAKKRAAEKVVDVAAELLDIYARRELKTSHRFTINDEEYNKFAAEFPFEMTFDQANAITDTLADMTTERAMDRLICGDVGFGKTEVAMRAAFVAVQGGKQVAILVPTTLLAQQHFDTLRDRFANWPVTIESISRLRSNQEIDEILSRLAAGKVDIIVGTHKLLGDQVKLKDLGLIIIDEEHRFGVPQKERHKSMRAEVDVLTLTATPIPRTLNMAVSGIRDLSIIATPPARRLSIKTFVMQRREQLVKEAISRELLRGGQVFFLHNEVRTIEQCAQELAELIPEARLGIGHGQMPKRQLEQVMSEFYHRQLNVLVCTTIIETGIDIPNANTIIIERADKFGLAQLHQLRGRVGRSHRQAYAYLLTPHPKAMTKDALKRLEAIEAAGDLGVGFTLATHDMEIRGAGELLGEDQSGQIESVGFSLYMDLLNRAISAMQNGQVPDPNAPLEPVSQEVNLHAATLIPDDYLPDVHARLILYKRISNATNADKLDDLQIEAIDRFGLLPDPLKRLFKVTELKLKSQSLGVVKIDLGEHRGRIEFSQATTVDPFKIVKLVQEQPNTYTMDGATRMRIKAELPEFAQRVEFMEQLLERLAPDATEDAA